MEPGWNQSQTRATWVGSEHSHNGAILLLKHYHGFTVIESWKIVPCHDNYQRNVT